MKPISEAWCIQIELNNYCPHSCAYCTRFTHHLRDDQKYNLGPETLKYILNAMEFKGYEGKLGIIGGEPTVHPQFELIGKVIFDNWTAKGKYIALWSSGGTKFYRWKEMIDKVFSWIAFNDKRDPACHHQAMTMAPKDMVPDEILRQELIENCWVQREWCPSITPKGVYFCECAAAWARILDGPDGWSMDEDWLNYGPEEYKSQMWACQLCGMCVPQPAQGLGEREKISKSVLAEFEEHNINVTGFELAEDFVDREEYAKRIAVGWAPGEYTPGRAKGGA
jgi:hypothetical protein